MIETLEKISSERNIRKQYIFMIYYSIGDYEKALNMLNTSIQKNSLITLYSTPDFIGLNCMITINSKKYSLILVCR